MDSSYRATFHALYSPAAAALYGHVIWAASDGTEVKATCVTDRVAHYRRLWDDVEDHGPVVQHVRGQMRMNGFENRQTQRPAILARREREHRKREAAA